MCSLSNKGYLPVAGSELRLMKNRLTPDETARVPCIDFFHCEFFDSQINDAPRQPESRLQADVSVTPNMLCNNPPT
jgi:hypothetical protein